jgi:hypothetical protein
MLTLQVATETSLLKWIDASNNMQEFTKARNLRISSTGEYLLDYLIYRNWKRRAPPHRHHRPAKDELDPTQILVLKGKSDEGYESSNSSTYQANRVLARPYSPLC